jgi:hypothetical protein
MNILSLVSLWLDNICQIQMKLLIFKKKLEVNKG